MASKSATLLLLRDELVGFARSKVMLVLWFAMPALALIGYLVLPQAMAGGFKLPFKVSATMYMSVVVSSLAGAIGAVMIAADIVNERTRKVYQLFAIRPIRRDALLWSKFLAVTGCVSVACILAIAAGVALDVARGASPSSAMLYDLVKSLATLVGVIAVSAGGGVLIGILSGTSMVAAVILVLQVGQLLSVVPLLPSVLGVLPDQFWIVMLLSFALAAALVYAGALLFRRVAL